MTTIIGISIYITFLVVIVLPIYACIGIIKIIIPIAFGTIYNSVILFYLIFKWFLWNTFIILLSVPCGIFIYGIFDGFIDGISDLPPNPNIVYELIYPFYRAFMGIFTGPVVCYKRLSSVN